MSDFKQRSFRFSRQLFIVAFSRVAFTVLGLVLCQILSREVSDFLASYLL